MLGFLLYFCTVASSGMLFCLQTGTKRGVLHDKAFSCPSVLHSYVVALAHQQVLGPVLRTEAVSSACNSHNLLFRQTKL